MKSTLSVNSGPHCRNCHKGSTDCAVCHSNWTDTSNPNTNYDGIPVSSLIQQPGAGTPGDPANLVWPRTIYTTSTALAAQFPPYLDPLNATDSYVAAHYNDVITLEDGSTSTVGHLLHATPSGNHALSIYTGMGFLWDDFFPGYKTTFLADKVTGLLFAPAANTNNTVQVKTERTTKWDSNWRSSTASIAMGQNLVGGVGEACSQDGFSWPHRTLGWKMLKDDLFGVNFDGTPVGVGETRAIDASNGTQLDENLAAKNADLFKPAHDIDSVCLDCHTPTIWNATNPSHLDSTSTTTDDANDELLQRGLP